MDLSVITYSVFIPLLNSIHELSQSFGLTSFGWSIVFLTAIVKLILTPLTFKQIKSTKKMQLIQPKLKALQDDLKRKEERYKDQPQKMQEARMEFQSKMMKFYQENGVNPLGGCLPLLLQMPILLGLFWTFSGSPFQSKPIMVNVKVVQASEAHKKHIKPASKGEIFVYEDGHRARVAVNTRGLTLVEGEEYLLEADKTMGDAHIDKTEITWSFFGNKTVNEFLEIQPNLDGSAKVIAKAKGSAKVQANLPAALAQKGFLFIKDFGNTGLFNKADGGINFDILILVILFGFSVWLSSKLNAPPIPRLKPGEIEDPQQAMQMDLK